MDYAKSLFAIAAAGLMAESLVACAQPAGPIPGPVDDVPPAASTPSNKEIARDREICPPGTIPRDESSRHKRSNMGEIQVETHLPDGTQCIKVPPGVDPTTRGRNQVEPLPLPYLLTRRRADLFVPGAEDTPDAATGFSAIQW